LYTIIYLELNKPEGDQSENEKQRPNCQLLPTEPLPFSPRENLKSNNTRDSLYPNPPSPEGMDVRSYNSQRPSITPAEVISISKINELTRSILYI
jgi:hypothetical protein